MLKAILGAAVLLTLGQPTWTGEWALEFTTPRGHAEYTMYLSQEGPRVTGHLTSEYGERQLRVTTNGDEIRIAWSEVENGKTLDITLTGTVKDDSITGTVKLGTVGEGPFKAERTGS
jgi:L-seryl-tRNA(Ser) seleniumtransferase